MKLHHCVTSLLSQSVNQSVTGCCGPAENVIERCKKKIKKKTFTEAGTRHSPITQHSIRKEGEKNIKRARERRFFNNFINIAQNHKFAMRALQSVEHTIISSGSRERKTGVKGQGRTDPAWKINTSEIRVVYGTE